MIIPVKVYEVGRATPSEKPRFVRDFKIVAPSIDACRRLVKDKITGEGYAVRALSVSPDPKPVGSILVYVWTKDVSALRRAPSRRRHRR